MAQRTTIKPQPKPEPEVLAKPVGTPEVMEIAGKAGKSFTALIKAGTGDVLNKRAKLLGEVRQRMAELSEAANLSGEQSKEVEDLEARVTDSLYQGLIESVLTKDMVSAELGAQFGFVPKQDGTPGKTPAGTGGIIRRRLVRGVAAHDFVSTGDGGKYFEGVEPDWTVSDEDSRTVEDIVRAVGDGDLSLWSAFDLFQKIKTNNINRPNIAFDAKRIMAIAERLGASAETSARAFINDPNLALAYEALADVFGTVNNVAGQLAAAK